LNAIGLLRPNNCMTNEYSTTNRLETKIQRIISQVILHKIKDKRLQRISIDEIRLTRDLSSAKIFCSTLNTNEPLDGLEKLLAKASGFFKTELSKSLSIKKVPNLLFIVDNHEEYAYQINLLIDKVVNDDKNSK